MREISTLAIKHTFFGFKMHTQCSPCDEKSVLTVPNPNEFGFLECAQRPGNKNGQSVGARSKQKKTA